MNIVAKIPKLAFVTRASQVVKEHTEYLAKRSQKVIFLPHTYSAYCGKEPQNS